MCGAVPRQGGGDCVDDNDNDDDCGNDDDDYDHIVIRCVRGRV